MKFGFLNYILMFSVLTISCADEALFNSGDKISKTITISDYSTIEIESTFEIDLVSDTVNYVVVSCGENLHPFIKINVVNDILYLKHDIKNKWSRKYERVQLELHTKPFSIINVRKPVKIYTQKEYIAPSFAIVDFMKYSELDMNINVDYCLIAMSSDNFGNFKVKGFAKNASIWGWGSCLVRADSLEAEYCNVIHRGIGNVYVNATRQLDVSIEASGNVFYGGNPPTINLQKKTGAGNLIKY